MPTETPAAAWLDKLKDALTRDLFVKLVMSKPGQAGGSLRSVHGRIVQLKNGPVLSLTYRHATRDEVKNHPLPDGADLLFPLAGTAFLQADLFTTEADWSLLYSKKGKATLLRRPPSVRELPPATHDLPKNRLIEAGPKAYLRALGIASSRGQLLQDGQKKFRQINKYIELISSLLGDAGLPRDLHVVDMGSGKGYLTFALYDYLTSEGYAPSMTGIELRPELVEFCNDVARQSGFDQLRFVATDIGQYTSDRIDMLIALHACDTATDLAIARGIRAGAPIIVVAPCCHKQLRRVLSGTPTLRPLLQYGILEERLAEWLTDGIRALLLEAHGYHTKVMEFVSTEHTPKNLMITGVKGKPRPEALEQLAALKLQFGIGEHYLEKLLAGG